MRRQIDFRARETADNNHRQPTRSNAGAWRISQPAVKCVKEDPGPRGEESKIDDGGRNIMMALDNQEHGNSHITETLKTGQVTEDGGFGLGENSPVNAETGPQQSQTIEARLVPDDEDVEARIVSRLEAEIIRDVGLRMTQDLTLAQVSVVKRHKVVIADEVKKKKEGESPEDSSTFNKRPIWIILGFLIILLLGGIAGGVAYRFTTSGGGGNGEPVASMVPSTAPSSLTTMDPPTAPVSLTSMAPSVAPITLVSLDSLLEELGLYIAPNETDFFLLLNNTKSHQAKALAWLQSDIITRTDGRSTTTVLERYALAVLYYSTSGESWFRDIPFMNSDSVCDWSRRDIGVFCGENQERVIRLSFFRLGLRGSLPWELVLLSDLQYVDFEENRLSGPIPTQMSELTQIRIFDASHNALSGMLPETFSPNTTTIILDKNKFSGTMPESWGTMMPLLRNLSLNKNFLTGPIPTTFGNLDNILSIRLQDNLLTGTIPSELGQLSTLTELTLGFNSFNLTESSIENNETICDFFLEGGSQFTVLQVDCDELDCPCCTSCCYPNQPNETCV